MAESKVAYLTSDQILAARDTEEPRYGRQRDGYGRKIPTRYQVLLKDKRWRRVYVCCFSNSGTAYIVTKDEPFLCISRVEDEIKKLADETRAKARFAGVKTTDKVATAFKVQD